jgi:hypothetical protein
VRTLAWALPRRWACFFCPRLFLAILRAFLDPGFTLRRDLVLACSLPRALPVALFFSPLVSTRDWKCPLGPREQRIVPLEQASFECSSSHLIDSRRGQRAPDGSIGARDYVQTLRILPKVSLRASGITRTSAVAVMKLASPMYLGTT